MINLSRAQWTYNLEPLFLVGAPRSGTTWLQAMLASHPLIYSGVETHFFASFADASKMISETKTSLGEYIHEKDFNLLMEDLFWHAISSLPKPLDSPNYFLEKTPNHCIYAPFILKVFPNARFIHLIRDGRAVSSSLLRVSRSWAKHWAPDELDKAVNQWVRFVRAGQNIPNIVRSPDQYIEVKYEDLRNDLRSNLMRLFEWINVSVDKTLINNISESTSMKAKNPFSSIVSPSPVKKGEPKAPLDFIGPASYKGGEWGLTHLQLLRIEYLAGKLLDELGYKNNRNKISFLENLLVSNRTQRILGLPKKFLDLMKDG